MNTRNLLVSVLMLVCVLLSACAPAATPSPAPTAIPPTAVRPTTVSSNQITFHSPENAAFHLPLTFSYTSGWETNVHANAIDIVNANPAVPQREWWGAGISLVDGAKVADPAKITDPAQMKTSSLSDFVPWPADFFAYVSSIPGMKVMQAPTPVTIGGVQGTQIIVRTPAVMHTMLWLKDDWTGLGDDYSNRIKQLILLDVNGELVLLEFDDSPEKFDERYPLVQEIFNSITFTK